MKRSIAALSAAAAIAVTFALDAWLKAVFFIPGSGQRAILSVPFWLVSLIDHKNPGLTFDIAFPLPVLIIITIAILGLLAYELIIKILHGQTERAIALGIIMGGALGNLYDRWHIGYVRDWLLFFNRSAINLADVAIIVGLLVYLWVAGKTQESA